MTTARPSLGEPGFAALAASLFRCHFVGAAFNTRGLQHVGLAMAMEPGLRAIHRDPEAFRAALDRYLKLYNTHPFWTPLLVGVFLATEIKVARGVMPAAALDEIKNTTAFTLSAIGDSFFSGSLTALWSLVAACLVATGRFQAVWLLALGYLLLVEGFKTATFVMGYREGFAVLRRIRRLDLVNLARRVKVLNAAVLSLFWLVLGPMQHFVFTWMDLAVVLGLASWAAIRPGLPREPIFLALLAGGLCLSWFGLG